MSVFRLVWGVLGATIFFAHRDEIGGWSFSQGLIVLGMFSIFTGVMEAFFRLNIMALIEQVRDGRFDFVLVKPVNAQFYIAFITTFPSAALNVQAETIEIVIGLALASLLLFGSNRLWNFAIRSYVSASS